MPISTHYTNQRSPVRHIVRQLAAVTNPSVGYQSPEDVDRDIGSLLLQGYRIVSTHFLGSTVTNGVEHFGVMYIFQMDASELESLKRSETTPRKPREVPEEATKE